MLSGDTQALPRISVPGVDGVLPTVALTLASTHKPAPVVAAAVAPAPEPEVQVSMVQVSMVQALLAAAPEAPVESHAQIYEEAMATIAALASSWTSPVKVTGRHRDAA